MSLSVNSRPTKTASGVLSTVNSIHLPMQYELQSNLFPTNSSDTTFNVSSVASASNGATFTTSAPHGLSALEWVTLTNFSEDYNGNFQILAVPSTTTITVGVTYTSTDTGNAVKYYNNYHAKIRIYAGLPPYHGDQASKPLRLIDTVDIIPESDNTLNVNVAPLIKQDMEYNFDDTILLPDYNQITACYISYAEEYDAVSGGEVVTNTTSFTDDEVSGCTATSELVTNGGFTGNATGWTLDGDDILSLLGLTATANFAYDSNDIQVSLDQNEYSGEVQQSIDFNPFLTYDGSIDISSSGVFPALYIYLYDTGRDDYQNVYLNPSSSGTITFSFQPNNEYDTLVIFVLSFVDSNTIDIDNVSLEATDCNYYVWGIDGKRPFGTANAGNYIDKIINTKFLGESFTNSPILFPDFAFYESFYIPNATAESLGNIGSTYVEVIQQDRSGNEIERDLVTISLANDGYYHQKINQIFTDSSVKKALVRLINDPPNSLTSGDDGTFEDTFANWSATIAADSGTPARNSQVAQSGSYSLSNFNSTLFTNDGSIDMAYDDIGITIGAGETWVGKAWVYLSPNQMIDYDDAGGGADVATYSSFTLADQTGNCDVSTKRVVNLVNWSLTAVSIQDAIRDGNVLLGETAGTSGSPIASTGWVQIESEFTNNTASAVTCKLSVRLVSEVNGGEFQYNYNSTSATPNSVLATDTWTLEGPRLALTAQRSIEVDQDCTNQDFFLMWLNNNGGYDCYNFSARKVSSVDVESSKEVYRNPINNWSDSFTSNKFAHDFLEVKARERYTLRSKGLTPYQVDAIEQVIYSIKCYRIDSSGTVTGVNVDKSSFRKYEDRERQIILSFDVKATDYLPIQSQ